MNESTPSSALTRSCVGPDGFNLMYHESCRECREMAVSEVHRTFPQTLQLLVVTARTIGGALPCSVVKEAQVRPMLLAGLGTLKSSAFHGALYRQLSRTLGEYFTLSGCGNQRSARPSRFVRPMNAVVFSDRSRQRRVDVFVGTS